MARYSAPPLSELSIALQFGAPLPLTPNLAINVFQELKQKYPTLMLKEALGKIGAPPVAMFKSVDDIAPRYWFSSLDNNLLVQLQSDLVAFNWRKQSEIGETSTTPYPGFDNMWSEHKRLTELIFGVAGVSTAPPPAAINLFYDNMWLRQDGKNLEDYFAFWKKIGLVTGGTMVQFSIARFEGAIAEAARIDVTAQTGGMEVDGKPVGVCRLQLSALDYPTKSDEIEATLHNMHRQVTDLFERLTTLSAQEAWK